MFCSSRPVSVALGSSQPAVTLTVTSSSSTVTSAFFELQKLNTSSSLVADIFQRSPPLEDGTLWRQHPGSSLSPAAFLEYIRLINLHSFDKVAHQLAADRSGCRVWPAAEVGGTPSRTDVYDVPASVVRPAVVRPTPLQSFVSESHRRQLDTVQSTSSSFISSSQQPPLKLWRPGLRSAGSRDPTPLLYCGSSDSTPSFLRPPPAVLFPPPPLPLPSETAVPTSSSSSTSLEFASWLPRNCAGILSAVMQRQVAAAAAAVAERRSSFQASGPSPLSSQRQFDVLPTPRLSGPPTRLPTPPSTGSKRLFSCPQCRYLTDRKNNLKRHVSTMHHESDKQLECCTIVFKSKASLRDHVLIFHGAGYQCRHCGRNFCRKALLKRHLTVHSGQKDYVCGRCDYATSHKSNLERHKKVGYINVS